MGREFDNSTWRYYWHEPTGSGRNVFCIFERRITLTSYPKTAEILLFVDSLYRLIVNGTICGYGPARFLPSHPEYDAYDISSLLRGGENIIRIEANAVGTPTYQAVPSIAGVAVCGQIDGTISLDMEEGWLVRRSCAWDPDSENYSFAQGPVEICDTREFKRERDILYPPVTVQGGAWGKLSERGLRAPSLLVRSPARIVTCATLKSDVFRVGFRCPVVSGGRRPFYTYIFSPREQEVEAGAFWGPLGIHGKWLDHSPCTVRGNRNTVRIPLHTGWNFFFGIPEILKPAWAWQMDLPSDRGLQVRGLPETANPAAFCLGPLTAVDEIPKHPPECAEDLPGFPASWPPTGGMRRTSSPARDLAWDLPDKPLVPSNSPWRLPLDFPAERDATLVVDFEDEYLGHAFVEIDASAGTVIDIGHDERLRENGTPDYFRCNPFLNSADRFILRGGRQHIETFHKRGGRYLQVTIRGASGPVRIHAAGVRSTCGEYPRTGAFACGDADLDWAWEAGDRTLRASMADGWIDPWRERGLYIGDALVQGHATRKITSDWRLDPWCLRLWARAQFPDGQLPDVVPSHPHRPLCDYTLIWIIALRNFWAASGDLALVQELWPAIPRIFASPVWKPAEGGLWKVTPDMKIFVDWGVVPEERLGLNGCLNAFRFRALECAAELAETIGYEQEAGAFRKEAEDVVVAFRQVFWDGKLGRFAAAKIDGEVFCGPGLHANALALAFGMCGEGRVGAVADYLAEGLRISDGFPPGRCEIYFLYYALEALYRAGRAGAAEDAMREYYGMMRRSGARTFWETLCEGAKGNDSMCHGWSSGALPYLSERVLGVRPLVPGDPSRMLVAPESETLDHAEGIVPHPAGPITVRWKIEDHDLKIAVEKPDGVDIEIRPQGRLGALTVVLKTA
jgi:hypothetical protein